MSDITAALRKLSRYKLLVGIPQANDARPDDKTQFGNAAIGYVMEFGAPESNVPARPSLVPGVEDARDAITTAFEHALKAALEGDFGRAEQNLNIAGTKAVASVIAKIAAGVPPPLKAATVAARARRSKGSSYRRKATAADQRAYNQQWETEHMFSGAQGLSGSPTTPYWDTGDFVRAHTYVIEKPN